MNHDIVLILCSFLIYAGLMWASTRIAHAIGKFTIVISPIHEREVDKIMEAEQHG